MARSFLIDIRRLDNEGGNRRVADAALYALSGARGSMAVEREEPLAAAPGEPSVSTASLSGARVSLSLPLSVLNFRVFTFAFEEREKIRSVLPFELDGLVIGGSSSVVFDFIVTPVEGSFEVLAAYVERGAVQAALDFASSLGADPESVSCVELGALLSSGARLSPAALSAAGPLNGPERALAAAREAARPSINLRVGRFAPAREKTARARAVSIASILLAIIAFLLAADLAARGVAARLDAAAARSFVRERFGTLFPGERAAADELHILKARLKEMKAVGSGASGVKPLDLFLALSRAGAKGVVISEISADASTVILRGEADSAKAVEAAAAAYSSFLPELKVMEVRPSGGGVASFSIAAGPFKGNVKGGGK